MQIEGVLEDIVFRNEENGYTVMILDCSGEPLTVTGCFPVIAEGSILIVNGEYKMTKYGRQLSAEGFRVVKPASKDGIIRFLSSGIIKGIGPVTAAAIVAHFGLSALDIIKNNPEQLKRVKGISAKKAMAIAAEYKNVFLIQNTIIALQGYDISLNMCQKIYSEYGPESENVVRSNPYKLVEDVDGIGFLTADRIAKRVGVQPDSFFRKRAASVHLLQEAADKSGHTYLPADMYTAMLNSLIGTDIGVAGAEELIDELALNSVVKKFVKEGKTCVALAKLYYIERSAAFNLTTIKDQCDNYSIDVSEQIRQFELENNIELHISQAQAVHSAVNNGVSVITGGPGTGKTTILKCIIQILKRAGATLLLTAPTGRAAKRLSEAAGEEAKTIHRALGAEFAEGRSRFYYGESNKLPEDFIIVDEMSMVDCYLMNSLLKALRHGAKLLLVGDKDQLASVGAGNVLADIIKSGTVPCSLLTQIYRQAADSGIIMNAHMINAGNMPKLTGSDFFMSSVSEPENICETVIGMVTRRIPDYLNTTPSSIQVLAALKNGAAGVNNLNLRLQAALNPPNNQRRDIKYSDTVLREGDRVMHVVNNYELGWKRYENGRHEEGTGVFNGDIGIITEVMPGTSELTVQFEDQRVCLYTHENLMELTLAYAITVHKSQGCEFPVVVMPIIRGSSAIMTRNLLYTAVTRAKSMVVLVGEPGSVRAMVNNLDVSVRYTMLADFLVASDNTLFSLGT